VTPEDVFYYFTIAGDRGEVLMVYLTSAPLLRRTFDCKLANGNVTAQFRLVVN